MDFALETARPRTGSAMLFAVRGRSDFIGLLLERDAEKSRNDARAGDERALHRA